MPRATLPLRPSAKAGSGVVRLECCVIRFAANLTTSAAGTLRYHRPPPPRRRHAGKRPDSAPGSDGPSWGFDEKTSGVAPA